MATTVAELEARLDANTKAFDSKMSSSEKTMQSVGKTAGRLGLILGGAVAAGAVVAIKAASDLSEQINKANVVFAGSEKQVIAWSETTAEAFGISQRAALEAAGTFGNMLVPMGFARQEAAKMSTNMVELAADMASFNNASPEETLEALRAGLSGETEPLRRFGVFLNQARIEEEALRLGLVKQGEELDAAAKAQATYSIILQDTADTQGDFGRTSGSLANQQRILTAQLEDTAASLGQMLLPAATSVLGAFTDLVGVMGRHRDASAALVVGVAALSGALLLLRASVSIYTSTTLTAIKATKGLRLAMAITPWGLAAVAVAGLVGWIIKQQEAANEAADAQQDLTSAVRDYDSAVSNAAKAAQENTEAGFRLEAADIAVIRARKALNQVERDGHTTSVDLREAQLNLAQAQNERREAEHELTRTGNVLRDEQRKQVNSMAGVQGQVERLSDIYRRKLFQETHNVTAASGEMARGLQHVSQDGSRAGDVVAEYAGQLRKAAQQAQQDNPKLAATARIAADLAEAWGRVVSLPEARHFVATFRVQTTLEEHRTEQRAKGGPVFPGRSYIVGEYRPEIFVPSTAGTILPRVPSGDGGGGVMQVNLHLGGRQIASALVDLDQRQKRNGGRGFL